MKKFFSVKRWRIIILCVVCVAGLLTTFLLARQMISTYRVADDARQQSSAELMARTVFNETNTYIDLLHSLRGFFKASDYVSKDEFMTFVNALDIDNRYPGLSSLAYSERESVDDYSLTELKELGFTDVPETGDVYITKYIYPPSIAKQLEGSVLNYEPKRASSIFESVRKGKVRSTPAIFFRTGFDGVLLIIPLQSKEQQGVGIVAIRLPTFVETILTAHRTDKVFSLHVYDGEEMKEVYEHGVTSEDDIDNAVYSASVSVGEIPWTLYIHRFVGSQDLNTTQILQVVAIVLGGLVGTLLLVLLIMQFFLRLRIARRSVGHHTRGK